MNKEENNLRLIQGTEKRLYSCPSCTQGARSLEGNVGLAEVVREGEKEDCEDMMENDGIKSSLGKSK